MTKLAVIYYSATGHGTTMAQHVAKAAEEAGAEVRLRHVAETVDPAFFAENPAWTANYRATKDLTAASGDDIVWADAVIFGSPTRFGSPASQLRAFIDSLGGLWQQGQLADKVYAGFTSSQTAHGGQETTLLSLYISLMHFGGIIVPPGYTDPLKFADGNPLWRQPDHRSRQQRTGIRYHHRGTASSGQARRREHRPARRLGPRPRP